jgi:hypothetical protein
LRLFVVGQLSGRFKRRDERKMSKIFSVVQTVPHHEPSGYFLTQVSDWNPGGVGDAFSQEGADLKARGIP